MIPCPNCVDGCRDCEGRGMVEEIPDDRTPLADWLPYPAPTCVACLTGLGKHTEDLTCSEFPF